MRRAKIFATDPFDPVAVIDTEPLFVNAGVPEITPPALSESHARPVFRDHTQPLPQFGAVNTTGL